MTSKDASKKRLVMTRASRVPLATRSPGCAHDAPVLRVVVPDATPAAPEAGGDPTWDQLLDDCIESLGTFSYAELCAVMPVLRKRARLIPPAPTPARARALGLRTHGVTPA